MGHFAKIENNIVTEVIVADIDTLNSFLDQGILSGTWIQTSYNTRGGVHYAPNVLPLSADGGTPLRKNYAHVGYTYDPLRDAFIPPKPIEFPSFILNESTCLWEPPIPMPQGGHEYKWHEHTISWVPFKSIKRIPSLSAT